MERPRLMQMPIGNGMEFLEYEGCAETAYKIFRAYGEPKSPAVQRVENERHAREIAERLKPVANLLVAPPSRYLDPDYVPIESPRWSGMANL